MVEVTAQVDSQLIRITPVELVDAIRSERVRFPSPGYPSAAETARVLNAVHRRYPQRSLLLWQDPADGPDAGTWLLDGGDLVSALLRGMAVLPERPSAEPVFFDVDSDEVIAGGRRPDDRHVLLEVGPLLAAEDLDRHLAVEHLAGLSAERARTFGRALREHAIPVQVVSLPKAELPRLFYYIN